MSYQRPTIGNQGVQTRSFQQAAPQYPGAGQYPVPYQTMDISGFSQPPATMSPSGGGGGGLSSLLSGFGVGGSGAGGGSSFNIAQIKQVIDRLGGIEGIVDTMTKVQRMVQTVQQVAPLVKVLMGSFGKGSKTKGDSDAAPKRRRRRKRRTGPVGKTRVKRRVAP